MRFPKVKTLAIAIAGVSLFAVDTAQAGLDSVCSTCAGQPQAPKSKTPHKHSVKQKKSGQFCAECAAKMQAQGMTPPPAMIAATSGGCATCGTVTTATAPGYAIVGDGSPSPVMASANGGAPGYAIVGGTMVSSEPAPVGVMRTNYRDDGPAHGAPGASVAPNRPGIANVGGIPYAQPNEVPPSLYAPPKRRHSILAKIIGIPDFGRGRAEAESRARENHAMTSYAPNGGSPADLPASVVYGGR
jgi:hypothetical protein